MLIVPAQTKIRRQKEKRCQQGSFALLQFFIIICCLFVFPTLSPCFAGGDSLCWCWLTGHQPPDTRQGRVEKLATSHQTEWEKPFLRSTFVLQHFTLTTTPQRLHQQAFSSMIFRRVCFSLSLFLFIYLFIIIYLFIYY